MHRPHDRLQMRRGALALARFAALFVVFFAILAPWPVSACTCVHRFLGAGKLYLGDDGLLPADARGIPFEGSLLRKDGRGQLTVEREREGRWVRVPFRLEELGRDLVLIIPRGGLIPGVRYRVRAVTPLKLKKFLEEEIRERGGRYIDDLDPIEIEAVVTRGDDAIAPMLGAMEAAVQLGELRYVSAGTCNDGDAVYAQVVDFRFALPAPLDRFRDYFLYATYVDDRPWTPRGDLCEMLHSGRNWTSWSDAPTGDLLYGACRGAERRGPPGLELGRHSVRVEARTPEGVLRHVARNSAVMGDAPDPVERARERPPSTMRVSPPTAPEQPVAATQRAAPDTRQYDRRRPPDTRGHRARSHRPPPGGR
ncbi:MAG: hypothetical protein R3B09_00290 [Nannocystaceae bacterium]